MTQTAPSQSNEEKAKRVYAQAVDCIKKQDFNGAEKYLTKSINIFPTADARVGRALRPRALLAAPNSVIHGVYVAIKQR